jgi:hypothetical protein
LEQTGDGRYDLSQRLDLIAQHRTEPSWLDKIALHVNDDQGHSSA